MTSNPRLDASLRVLLPHLPCVLADPKSLARLTAVGRQLPGGCPGILEVRLTPPSRQIDLALCLRHPEAARRVARVVSTPAVRRFLARWADGAWPRLPSLWVEWDLDSARDSRGLPLPILIAKLGVAAEPGWVTGELLPALHGEPLSPERSALAERCLAALSEGGPKPGRLLYAFGLHARPGRPLRLDFFGLELDAAVACLEPWAPDHARRLAGLAPMFAGVADIGRLHLSLDLLDEGLGGRFGVEASFTRLPRREPRWRGMFDRLVAAGLCSPERRDAVLAWPGWDSLRTAPEVWPVAEAGLTGFCARGLSHVKVVSRPDGPLEAKAYLSFNSVRTRPGRPPAALPRD